MFTQLLTPNPDIDCRPGWCLEYVRRAFDRPVVSPNATAAWNNSTSQHRDFLWPALWVPLYFAVRGVPEGHIVLKAPDGSVYSTTSPDSLVPRHHPSVQDLMNVYGNAGVPLTYRGWTEDIDGFPVVGLQVQTESTTKAGSFMAALTDDEQRELLTKTRELHRDYSQGILGVRRDGDSFSLIRSMAAKLGLGINETARAAKYGKK